MTSIRRPHLWPHCSSRDIFFVWYTDNHVFLRWRCYACECHNNWVTGTEKPSELMADELLRNKASSPTVAYCPVVLTDSISFLQNSCLSNELRWDGAIQIIQSQSEDLVGEMMLLLLLHRSSNMEETGFKPLQQVQWSRLPHPKVLLLHVKWSHDEYRGRDKIKTQHQLFVCVSSTRDYF